MTILVVDDYDEHRALLAFSLERCGYHVIQAASGAAAEEMALREQPDVILMDITMPLMDGFVATRRILARDKLRNTPIIAVSALIRDEVLSAALAAGCSEVISKPVDYELLEATIARLVHAEKP